MGKGRGDATYDDVLKAPPHQVAELINGTLYTHPRPSVRHANVTTVVNGVLHYPFRKGRGGPGGWVLLVEPELHLGRQVLVPDIGGWRRERMPEAPVGAFVEVAPSWVLEVLSPSTEAVDRSEKLPVYAAHGVANVWLIDPVQTTLEVFRLDGSTYRLLATHVGESKARVEPFEALELDLAELWER